MAIGCGNSNENRSLKPMHPIDKAIEKYSGLILDSDRVRRDAKKILAGKNKPNNPALWAKAQAEARKRFKVHPSRYSNLWASKWYKDQGGTWSRMDSDTKAYYFESKSTGRKRNTAVFASSAEAAKDKLKRPSPDDAKVYAVRDLNPTEKKQTKTGAWSRVRASGKSAEQDPRGKGFFGS